MSASARKPPRLEHVKFVRKGAAWYAYFNTGQKRDGKPIYAPMPKWGTTGFFDSYASLKAGRTRRAATAYTVANLADDYQRSTEYAQKAANTRKLYDIQLLKIVDLLGAFPANDVTPVDVMDMLDSQQWNAGTHNMVLATLGVIYRWGRRRRQLTTDPVRDVARLKGGSHEPWPEDVLSAALRADDATVRLAVHLLYFTGQRIGDVCKMRWGDIRGGYIHVRQTKTGKLVEPPLIADLQAELDKTSKTGVFILAETEGRLRRKLKAFTASLGAETVPHGLRKNAVIVLLEAGCTIAEVASITGQTHQVVEHYAARVNTRKLGKAAIVKLEAHRKIIPKTA